MNQAVNQAAVLLGPKENEIAAIAITTSSAATDVTTSAQLGDKGVTGKLVALVSDVNVYYKWGTGSSTVDETVLTGSNRGFLLPAGVIKYEFIQNTHIVMKGVGAGVMRIAISSP